MKNFKNIFFVVFFIFVFLSLIYSFTQDDGDARSKWPIVKNEFESIGNPVTAVPYAEDISKASKAFFISMGQSYITYLDEKSVEDFYKNEFKNKGWVKHSEEIFSRGLSKKRISFCKNGIEGIIDFARKPRGKYQITVRWDADRRLRPSCE